MLIWLPSLALVFDAALASQAGYGILFSMYADCHSPERLVKPVEDVKGELSRIHVVYSADLRHFPGLLSSMLSLSRHLEAPGSCTIHLIVHATEMAEAKELIRCFERELADMPAQPEVLPHEFRPLAVDFSSLQGQLHSNRPDLMNPMVFAWFNIQEYLPTAARAIYLDTDTIVNGDLGPLFRMQMEHAVAGVPMRRNLFLYRYFPNLRSKEHLVIKHVKIGRRKAYNSGVLVFDLVHWRSGNLTHNLEEWVRIFDGAGDADQLALNMEFQGAIDSADWRWNSWGMGCDVAPAYCLRAGGVPRPCTEEARIVHFNGPVKPWIGSGTVNPHSYLFAPFDARQRCGMLQ